jgi:hypothetical protein
MTDKTFTEKEVIEKMREMEFHTAGNSVLTKCLSYISDDYKQGRCTKLELDVLITIYNQFMAPRQPAPQQPPTEPTEEEPEQKEE